MAKVTFTEDEQQRARDAGKPLVAFAVNGKHCEGFPYGSFGSGDPVVPADLAEEAVEWFQAWMKRVKAAGTPPGKP